MITCADLPRYIAGTLDNTEHDDFTSHLLGCLPCQQAVEADCAEKLQRGMPPELDAFHAHLDRCARCKAHPHDLCSDGGELLRTTATQAAEKMTGRSARVSVAGVGPVIGITLALVAGLFAAGCHEAECIRQSDCAAPLVCNEELVCVPPATDDAGTDGGGDGGAVVRRDFGPGFCTVALRCEVFAAWGERAKQCEGALSASEVESVHQELACVIAGCPIPCAMQLNNVELKDPAQCWGCAEQKLGNLCAVRCP